METCDCAHAFLLVVDVIADRIKCLSVWADVDDRGIENQPGAAGLGHFSRGGVERPAGDACFEFFFGGAVFGVGAEEEGFGCSRFGGDLCRRKECYYEAYEAYDFLQEIDPFSSLEVEISLSLVDSVGVVNIELGS